jgi:hypothetical protein
VDANTAGINSKLQNIQFSLGLLDKWARDGRHDDALVAQLDSSIKHCLVVIQGIHNEIGGIAGAQGKRDKLKSLWNDGVVKEIEARLDSQTSALTFLLTTVQL